MKYKQFKRANKMKEICLGQCEVAYEAVWLATRMWHNQFANE